MRLCASLFVMLPCVVQTHICNTLLTLLIEFPSRPNHSNDFIFFLVCLPPAPLLCLFDNPSSLPWLPVDLLIALSDHIFQSECVSACTRSCLAMGATTPAPH